ncbi:MAG: hypothetical protein AAGF22_03870 [Pseudomonadota bacterium]
MVVHLEPSIAIVAGYINS